MVSWGAERSTARKSFPVIAQGHSERQQLFERFLGSRKLDGNAPGFEADARGQGSEALIHDGCGRSDQHLRLGKSLLTQGSDRIGEPLPASPLKRYRLLPGQFFQMSDELLAIRQAIGAHTFGDTGGEDLLGAAAADAAQFFDGVAVDVGRGSARSAAKMSSSFEILSAPREDAELGSGE